MLHTGDVKNVLISFSLLLYIYCNMLLLDLYNDARSMCLSVKSGGGQGGLITLQSTNWDQWELWPAWRPISFAAFLIPQMIHSLSWDWKSSKKQPDQNDVRNDFLISQLQWCLSGPYKLFDNRLFETMFHCISSLFLVQ